MALRKIVYIEDEMLRKKSRKVERFDERLHTLLDDMAETMYKNNGCGLAAPQVAVLKRVVVMDVGDGLIEMVNPEIVSREGAVDGVEGCISIPGRQGYVVRPQKVVVRAQDRNGAREITGEDWLARASVTRPTPRRPAVCGHQHEENFRYGDRRKRNLDANRFHGYAGLRGAKPARAGRIRPYDVVGVVCQRTGPRGAAAGLSPARPKNMRF